MRITRYRELHDKSGYCNPERLAHDEPSYSLNVSSAASMLERYKAVIDELFRPYAWPGGYPVLFATDAGDILCADCARKVYVNERTDVSCECYNEGPVMYCDECNAEIESAYGDPDNPGD